jgi:uncharacterized membrane protein/phage FluMu protein Com
MSIEFRCSQCSKLLRTGDETAGRQAKCPDCGAITKVPESTPPSVGGNPFNAAAPLYSPTADPRNPYQSPAAYAAERPSFVPGEIRPSKLDFSDAFSRSWELFKRQWGLCVAVVVIAQAITMAAGFVPFIGNIINMVVSIWLGVGQVIFFLKVARGQELRIEDVFSGWPYFGQALGASLLVGLLDVCIAAIFMVPLAVAAQGHGDEVLIAFVAIGGAVAAIPIAYVTLIFSQFLYLIVDRNMGVIESLVASKRLMEGNKATMLLVYLAIIPITLVALLPCGLGLVVAIPYFAVLFAVIHLSITGQQVA